MDRCKSGLVTFCRVWTFVESDFWSSHGQAESDAYEPTMHKQTECAQKLNHARIHNGLSMLINAYQTNFIKVHQLSNVWLCSFFSVKLSCFSDCLQMFNSFGSGNATWHNLLFYVWLWYGRITCLFNWFQSYNKLLQRGVLVALICDFYSGWSRGTLVNKNWRSNPEEIMFLEVLSKSLHSQQV